MVKKILLIRFSSIGDIIITTPVVKSLRQRFPQARIDYLTKQEFVPLLENCPDIDQTLGYDKSKTTLRTLKRRLKAEKYDLLIDLHNSLRSRYLRCGVASQKRVYAKPYFRRWLLTKFGLNFLRKAKPIYQRYYDACAGLDLLEHPAYFISFSPSDALSVQEYSRGVKPVLVSLSAAHFTKKWSLGKFAQLISKLPSKNIILLGGAKEVEDAGKLKELCSNSADIKDLSGKLDLLQTAALMKKSALLLCHDSGLLHLAQSQNLACVAIFGCTTQELGFFPIKENCRVVQVDLSCRPCTAKGLSACPRGHFRCMQSITAEMVMTKIEEVL